MASLLPIIALGAAAILLSRKKKKVVSEESSKELVERAKPPQLGGAILEESKLEFEKEFEPLSMQEENLAYDEEDDYEEVEKPVISSEDSYQKMREKCDQFIDAVHITPTETGEMPINKIAVEQSILPAMRQSAQGFVQNFGRPLDEESFGPRLVLAGLEAIAPGCGWEFEEAAQEFRYADGKRADGGRMGEVLGAIIDLSVFVLSEINQG